MHSSASPDASTAGPGIAENHCSLKRLPLKFLTCALSLGLPGRVNWNVTPSREPLLGYVAGKLRAAVDQDLIRQSAGGCHSRGIGKVNELVC